MSGSDQVASGIDAQENEQQEREAPEVGATVGEEGQGDADDGCEAEHHSYVDEHMEEEHAGHAVAVDSPEFIRLSLGKVDEPQDKHQEQDEHAGRRILPLRLRCRR